VKPFLVMHVTYDLIETWANTVATRRILTDSKNLEMHAEMLPVEKVLVG
jgi:hypothetical protein